ncbi:LytR/AlgR family response regulator transcription factor [Flavobacterium sp. SM2513]|uniref:LytR/AlgR family response regulator transcription factor n=1 Tax=Flavobacterium sp. SM2513 TaxID=3424766 RepID=UPI003D7F225A
MILSSKILIVEDEILIADYLKELLQQEHFAAIELAHDKEEALTLMQSFLPDIILMDINLHGANTGIDLVEHKNENASVLFLTGQSDLGLMTRAFATNPDAYLTKPIKKVDLIAAIRLQIHKQQLKFITVRDGYKMVKINLEDVLFVKSENNYIDIQLADKKYSIRQTLDAFIKEIQSEAFLRVHRSYIVNTSKITMKKTGSVIINQFEIPFSRNIDLSL